MSPSFTFLSNSSPETGEFDAPMKRSCFVSFVHYLSKLLEDLRSRLHLAHETNSFTRIQGHRFDLTFHISRRRSKEVARNCRSIGAAGDDVTLTRTIRRHRTAGSFPSRRRGVLQASK